MKIVFVLYSTDLAGGTRAIFEVSNRLRIRGYDIKIVALGGNHRWFNAEMPIGYVPIPRNLKYILQLYKVIRLRRRPYDAFVIESIASKLGFHADLVRILAEYISTRISDADAYVATFYPTALALYLTSLDHSAKKFYFLQDFPELVEEVDGKYGLRLFDLTLRLPFNIFLCVSNYVCELVKSVQPNVKTVVTGAGVDTRVFRPRDNSFRVSEKKVVMFIVRGLRYKGDSIAVEALNIVSSKIPIHALIVGSRTTIDKLFQKVKPRFTYSIFNYVDDETLAKLYSSSDVFVFTSYAEGFGLPPLEAMACGTPVVTTDCKGNRDYTISGYNALVVPPGNPKAVAEAVINLLTNDKLRERLIEGGLEIAKQWTWERVVNKFEEALKHSEET